MILSFRECFILYYTNLYLICRFYLLQMLVCKDEKQERSLDYAI